MTIQEALDITDEMKPNMMSRQLKLKYLTEVEQLIWSEIVMRHVHTPAQAVKPNYTEDTDAGTVLIVPEPYTKLYPAYLMSMIDWQNQEDARYGVDRTMYENAYEEMSDWWTRTHMPVQRVREFRI